MPRSATYVLLPTLALALAGLVSCTQSANESQAASTAATTAQQTSTPPASQASPAVQVLAVDLGRTIGTDKQVSERLDTFKPNDTIYASVHTSGSAPASKMAVKWTYQDGQVVDQAEQPIMLPEGASAMEFHLSKPSGLPEGNYKVEISGDGSPVQSRVFRVSSS